MGHAAYPPRHTLPAPLADALADAHHESGGSYRQVASLLGLDYGYWRRLTRGERCPSIRVAGRIITILGLDEETAEALLEVAVPKRG